MYMYKSMELRTVLQYWPDVTLVCDFFQRIFLSALFYWVVCALKFHRRRRCVYSLLCFSTALSGFVGVRRQRIEGKTLSVGKNAPGMMMQISRHMMMQTSRHSVARGFSHCQRARNVIRISRRGDALEFQR